MKTQKEKIYEIELQDFNDNMREAFSILHGLYKKILYNDPDWHFFYEGETTSLRCGAGHVSAIIAQLKRDDISYEPPQEWIEPWMLTAEFQDCFGPLFHTLSVLVMELFNRKALAAGVDDLIFGAADRVIHPFLNMATYLKHFKAGAERRALENWEAGVMGRLAITRAHLNGMIKGEQRMKKIMRRERKNEDKEVSH